MSMLELTTAELNKYNALTPILGSDIQQIVNAIPFNVNDRLKATIAVTQLIAFASQFRRNIMLWDDTEVPINAISVVIMGSGGGKDSSVNAARKCFAPGYEIIEEHRKKLVVQAAIKAAEADGQDSADQFDVYKAYMKSLPPIDLMPTTGPGLTQHINDLGDLPVSAGLLYAGEFSDELAYNPDMMENIKILAELYDVGTKAMKYTKGVEHRSKAINGQPVSALFVGSPGHILYDESTKKKFNIAFMSKLARRVNFCYVPERLEEEVFEDLDAMIAYEDAIIAQGKQARNAMADHIKDITNFHLPYAGKDISVSPEVTKLFKVYKRYNSDLADTHPNQESTYTLIRRHLQWKAIKLAGALAIFDKSHEIQTQHYIDAIRFSELLDNDMNMFEFDLNKAAHERLADYIKTITLEGKAQISAHDLKKLGFTFTTTKAKLQELVTLCSSYDTSGIYSLINDGGAIQYELIIKTDILTMSYQPIDTTALNSAVACNDTDAIRAAKHTIATRAVHGFKTAEILFEDLAEFLSDDWAYSPFTFSNGTRSKDNIISGAKFLVFDIDKSPLSADEAHLLLSDINHHIVLSSDANNYFKYRVLIELDAIVELDTRTWKQFYANVAKDLALDIDELPQSQIFYSYANRTILSVTDADPLEIREYVVAAKEHQAEKTKTNPTLTKPQAKAKLDDPETTFAFAFYADYGQGSRQIIRAMYYLRDELYGTVEQALELFEEIQTFWTDPFEPTRAAHLRDQITRLFNNVTRT